MSKQFFGTFPPSLTQSSKAGEHFMMIDSYESTNATTNDGVKLSSIALYIPTGSLNTSFTGNYEGLESAETNVKRGQAILAGQQIGVGPAGRFSQIGTATLDSLKQTFSKAVDSGGFIRAQGLAPNNHLALVYNGPNQFREHTFAFKFFPKNQPESVEVKNIITEFKQGTLPRLSGGGQTELKDAFFKSPRHHKIKFITNGKDNNYLFEIGTSVITAMTVNYDPQGVVGFHEDGSPVSVDLSLTFKEIELPISDDKLTTTTRRLSQFNTAIQGQASAINPQVDTVADRRTGFFDFE